MTEIIEPRAQELLTLVGEDLRRAGLDRQITAGFVLAGGGSQLRGFAELADDVFQMPVRIAEPRGILDMPGEVATPQYAAVVGLVLHAAKTRRVAAQKGNTLVSKLKAMFAGA